MANSHYYRAIQRIFQQHKSGESQNNNIQNLLANRITAVNYDEIEPTLRFLRDNIKAALNVIDGKPSETTYSILDKLEEAFNRFSDLSKNLTGLPLNIVVFGALCTQISVIGAAGVAAGGYLANKCCEDRYKNKIEKAHNKLKENLDILDLKIQKFQKEQGGYDYHRFFTKKSVAFVATAGIAIYNREYFVDVVLPAITAMFGVGLSYMSPDIILSMLGLSNKNNYGAQNFSVNHPKI